MNVRSHKVTTNNVLAGKTFLNRTLLISAAVIKDATNQSTNNTVCKPSELPIYVTEKEPQTTPEICSEEPGSFELGVGSVRRTVFKFLDQFSVLTSKTQDIAEAGLVQGQALLNFLQQPEDSTPKYGAIVVGGLSGFIFGLRGGIIKKVIYTSTGALGMAALCYPTEATKYSKIGYAYGTIALNFLYGVKKDDPSLELPSLPNFNPTDVWNKIKSFNQSDTVTDSTKNTGEVKTAVINSSQIVSDAHDLATSSSCQHSIDSYMGQHEESCPISDDSKIVK
ncbi:hypothetical protein FQA39_LY06779 [Lamprigera yunnana]|nr:hypothetical protein FQA39_LY06779 [Lamprigera yunnana]